MIFIEEVEIGAEYQNVIYDYWIKAKMPNGRMINVFDYSCLDLRNKVSTLVECILFANLTNMKEHKEIISGTFIGKIRITDWNYFASDISKEKEYFALETDEGVILFNPNEIGGMDLVINEKLELNVIRYDLVGLN